MEVEYEPAGPKPIKKLSKDVVNQIAAAEIIHRPSNAIKELIENSLDAGSTSIKLTLKDGGLKLIQIADNGHGINKADLPLLCTRYATSKLAKFEDLQSLVTYGFRGEALASISYVSHVEVVTKTREEGCGWKAHYQDGELVPYKPGAGIDPKPAAANDGTIINAEDLFYNMPLRKRAFKSPSDEYNRVLDVVTKYAIHNPHSAWSCKKAGTAMSDITTPVASTTKSNIALLYGSALANDLIELPKVVLKPEEKLGASLKGWISGANSSWARKGGWIIFINNRLVDSGRIKKAVDSLYTTYLPKGASPWCYLSLEIDPTKVDVNVSPTKSEVHFLNQDEMIDAIVGAIQVVLAGANTSRSFAVQTLLPGTAGPSKTPTNDTIRKAAPNYKVRMDPTNRTLDSMITIPHPSQIGDFIESQRDETQVERPAKRRAIDVDPDDNPEMELEEETDNTSAWTKGPGAIPESECDFTSIQELRREVGKGNQDVGDIMLKHAFVGIVDLSLGLSLIQYSTKLYLVNHTSLAEEHFYQLGLRQFGAFNRLRLDPPPLLRDLISLAAEDEQGIQENNLNLNEVVESITNLLLDKREMIDEYFSISVTSEGTLESIPMLLKGYTPNLDRLPHFLLCLGTRVNWGEEKECFGSILRELAFFYAPRSLPSTLDSNDKQDGEEIDGTGDGGEGKEEEKHARWQLEHILFPSMRKYTHWKRDSLSNGDLKQVANLPDLFRIFERC